MSKSNIKTLVDKYFDGETNLEEERYLKSYFNSATDIDAELEIFIPFFKNMSESQLIKAPLELEQKVLKSISTKDVSIAPKTPAKVRRLMPTLLKVASVFVIGVSLYFLTQQFTNTKSHTVAMTEDTYDSPEEAYAAYKAAIALASRKIKKGEDKVKNEMSYVKVLTSIVKKK